MLLKLILLGTLSSAFFSTTFVLNELMSVSGGHWLWSASLRYVFMIALLIIIIIFQNGPNRLKELYFLFIKYYKFWIVSGTIGFGFFYALICFGADYSPAWVVASTWQFTVVATLFVLMAFQRSFPKRVWIFSLIIFIGVCLVNLSHIEDFNLTDLLVGGIPVLIASFCYPLGNQLVWEAKNGGYKNIPDISSHLLSNAFNKVLLMSIGSIPFWIVLLLLLMPSPPSNFQVLNTFFVAIFSGVLATSIFLYARSLAKDTKEIAGVDATQASEVIFALIGGFLLLGVESLSLISVFGIALILVGLFLFSKFGNK